MRNFHYRTLAETLNKGRSAFPALVLTGARQTGKSTLLKKLFPECNYLTFDNPTITLSAKSDPARFIEELPLPVILDEFQYVPEILPYIKMAIDENRSQKGSFLLTGSQMFPLMQNITETLAGRIALFHLYGFSLYEIYPDLKELEKLTHSKEILNGGYPEIALGHPDRNLFFLSYVATYIERDIRHVQNVSDLLMFQNFIRILATRIGSILNISSIASDLGVSQPTASKWISLLETSGIIILLRPYLKNIGKRLIKSPKIYFCDTGLASWLLRLQNENQIRESTLEGALFENLVIMEVVKKITANSINANIWYYRDSNGKEIDLMIEDGRGLSGIEIKCTKTIRKEHFHALLSEQKLLDIRQNFIVTLVKERLTFEDGVANIHWTKASSLVER